MKPANPAAQPETLLEHGPFVRRIARSLLFDEHRVDDVVQETWVAALERPPRGAIRSWLGTVVRNFSLRTLRGESRRARRELAAARPEAVPSTEEIAARESARRTVVEAVLALEEPFRSAILLRFYEGLPPRAIARRLGIPVETARSRVKRGVELLRARLDGEHRGGRRSWCLALVPLALPRPGEAAGLLALGSIAMSTVSKIGIAATLAVGAFVALRSEETRESDARPEVAVAAASGVRAPGPGPARESDPLPEAAPAPKRSPVGGDLPPTEPAPVVPPPAAPVGVVFGRVTDRADRPVEGAEVKLSIPIRRVDAEGKESFSFGPLGVHATAKTDAEGLYRTDVPEGGRLQLLVKKDGFDFEAVNRHVPAPPFEERVDVILERKIVSTIRGRLLDLSGGPLPAEEIRFLLSDPTGRDTLFLVPEGASVPRPERPPQGPSGIWALSMRRPEGPESQEERARIDAESATFEIEARATWEWLVTAYFRGEVIAEKSWKEGDGEVEFRLDPQALRATLGSLELRGVAAATGEAVPIARGRLRRSGDLAHRVIWVRDGTEARVEGIRAGRYEVVANAGGYAESGASFEVSAGQTTRVDLPFRRPAATRLRLVPLEGWLPGPREQNASFFDMAGRGLLCSASFEAEGGETFLRVTNVPPGGCWIVLHGNSMRLDLSNEESRPLDFPIRRPRLLKNRYKPDPRTIGPGSSLVVTQRLFAEGGVPACNSTVYTSAAPGGTVDLSLEAPPGRYTLELAQPGRAAVRREVTIGDAAITEIAVEGR